MTKSLMTPPEREEYAAGSKVAAKAWNLFKDFTGTSEEKKYIKKSLSDVEQTINKAPSNLNKSDTMKYVATELEMPIGEVKNIEKTLAIQAGGGGKKTDSILDKVVQGARAKFKEQTKFQKKDETSAYTREANERAVNSLFTGTKAGLAIGVPVGVGGLNFFQDLSAEQAANVEKNKPVNVTDITDGTIDSAYSKASSNPTKYVFMKSNKPYIKFKGKTMPLNLATDEEDVVLDLVPRSTKAEGGLPDLTGDGKVTQADVLKGRGVFQEGGSLLMPEEGMPVDTYDNIPPEEMDEAMASQLPDDEMEDDYLNYVIGESLDDSEQQYLAQVLQDDPQLGDILDKVMTVASEFSGQGEVAGPGTGVSDSIPARLSDGEFVMTKKATDQIGSENLQVMMDDAERAYDGGYQMKAEGGMMDEDPKDPMMSKTKEEIEKLMMGANRMPSLQ